MWLHEMFTNCTHPCPQPRSRYRAFLAIPMVSPPGRPQPSKKNHHLTSNLRDSNMKFLKNSVSDIYKSGNLHFCHSLRDSDPATMGPCTPSRQLPEGDRLSGRVWPFQAHLTHFLLLSRAPPTGGRACNICLFLSLDPDFSVFVF